MDGITLLIMAIIILVMHTFSVLSRWAVTMLDRALCKLKNSIIEEHDEIIAKELTLNREIYTSLAVYLIQANKTKKAFSIDKPDHP